MLTRRGWEYHDSGFYLGGPSQRGLNALNLLRMMCIISCLFSPPPLRPDVPSAPAA